MSPRRRPTRSSERSGRRAARTSRPRERRVRTTRTVRLGQPTVRLRVFLVVVALLLGLAGVRAFQLQALDPEAFAAEAAAKMQTTRDEPAARGTITDRNGVVLAETEPGFMVFVDPDMIVTNGADKRYPMNEQKQAEAKAAPGAVADILVAHLGGKKQDYLEIFNRRNAKTGKRSRYEVVARKVPAHTFQLILDDMRKGKGGEQVGEDGARRWYGVFGESDPIRSYPNRATGANVVGFVNGEGKGAGGLEYALEAKLRGTPGKTTFDRSTYGRIPLGTNIMVPAQDGLDHELTIDSDLQWMADQFLAQGIRSAGAKSGTATVMNVQTGEILAMSVLPTYDSSNPGSADPDDLGNRGVTQALEPGSTQKVLTMAALADQGLVTPDTKVRVPGRIASGSGYVRDSFAHDTLQLTARGIVAQSSNVGTIQLARQLEKAKLHDYLESFGLGQRTGLGLPGESAGSLPGADMADYTRDQIAFGQGLSATSVQMAAAIASVVNGGVYHQPTIIRRATDAEGKAVELAEPTSRRVISEEASQMTVEMMEAVTMAKPDERTIPGYRTAGKSGTAQRYEPKCKCYRGFTSSYVAVAPAEDPQLLVQVVIDQPTKGNLGSQLALPVVNQILQVALPRYNVLPSTTEAPRKPLTFG
ncbi:penicillin-binding protein 2 [uncultured Tessaracoccus sp.]|uniref:peptidoglycan D,D-transpeptidase FtsI family protein n=1 Tax=uncultured Tessaracoccus sp. TaxID=905023 RepID=UPI0025E95021|nr:penicillin-binding protein 2 [uncultured Tessaracoccus sp.]